MPKSQPVRPLGFPVKPEGFRPGGWTEGKIIYILQVFWGNFLSIRLFKPTGAQEQARKTTGPARLVRLASELAKLVSEPAKPVLDPARQASKLASQASDSASQASDGRTNGWMNERNITPFYRTLSPIGAAAPLHPNYNQKT